MRFENYVLEPDRDIKSKMVVPVKRIVSVKGDAMIPEDGAVV